MEEMVSQLSVMVEDLKVEKRYAPSTLASRRIREAQAAVEQAKVLVSAAVNAGESDARKRLDTALDVLVQRKADQETEARAIRRGLYGKPTRNKATAEATVVEVTTAVGVAEDAVGVDYTVDYD